MCQCVPRLQPDPPVAREIWSRDDVGPLGQFCKFFGSGLEGDPDCGRFERDNREHLACNLEQKVVAPLDLLGRVRERNTEFADGIGGHERVVVIWARPWERCWISGSEYF